MASIPPIRAGNRGRGGHELPLRPETYSLRFRRFMNRDILQGSGISERIVTTVLYLAAQFFGGPLVKIATLIFTGSAAYQVFKNGNMTHLWVSKAIAASFLVAYLGLKLS